MMDIKKLFFFWSSKLNRKAERARRGGGYRKAEQSKQDEDMEKELDYQQSVSTEAEA
jgi:hypothetical protein